MSYIKKLIFLIAMNFMMVTPVFAVEEEYQNNAGVVLSECEYEFISELFYDGFQDEMTMADYQNIFSDGINCHSIIKHSNANFVPYGTSHSTTSKTLNISAACQSDTCLISITGLWKKNPVVRSYDVLGARLHNTALANNQIVTRMISSIGTTPADALKTVTGGLGASIKLPSTATDLSFSQYFHVANRGTVFASYQHATSNITLADSQNFTVGASGLGGVYVFPASISQKFDAMKGVSITL